MYVADMNGEVFEMMPPANWYRDPDWPRYLRYWDGQQWTAHRRYAAQEKSSAVAALLTFLWPGGGHLYLGLTNKGLPYFVINGIFLVLELMCLMFPLALLLVWPLAFMVWVVTLCMTIGSVARDTERVNGGNLS